VKTNKSNENSKSNKRDIRRHHIERLKKARKYYWGYNNRNAWWRDNQSMSPRELGRVVQNPQTCSCSGCGNSRNHSWFKRECQTVQERSFFEAYKSYGMEEEDV
jgi:hypothetical protein